MAGRIATFEEFLASQPIQVDITSLAIALILAALLSYILAKLYIKYGTSISNRKKFSDNFILLTMITTLVIAIVKSSLALSLGLVGALSIVRFRAAIKEPEELVFLFLAIAIGLGLGANQILVTLVSFAIISLFIWGRHFTYKKEESQNLYLNISGKTEKDSMLKEIKIILSKYCDSVRLRRFDHTQDNTFEASFLIDIDSINKLENTMEELKKLSPSINVTYLDKIGIY
jgi:hypothetical protein